MIGKQLMIDRFKRTDYGGDLDSTGLLKGKWHVEEVPLARKKCGN